MDFCHVPCGLGLGTMVRSSERINKNYTDTWRVAATGCLLLPQPGSSARLLGTAQREELASPISVGKQSQTIPIWRKKLQLILFAHTDQRSINTHIYGPRGELCYPSWAWSWWVMVLPIVPWVQGLGSSPQAMSMSKHTLTQVFLLSRQSLSIFIACLDRWSRAHSPHCSISSLETGKHVSLTLSSVVKSHSLMHI